MEISSYENPDRSFTVACKVSLKELTYSNEVILPEIIQMIAKEIVNKFHEDDEQFMELRKRVFDDLAKRLPQVIIEKVSGLEIGKDILKPAIEKTQRKFRGIGGGY